MTIIKLIKPNKSTPYYQIIFNDPLNSMALFDNNLTWKYNDQPNASVSLGITKTDLLSLKYLLEKIK